METDKLKLVTIMLPAYNEEESFPILKECMEKVLEDNPGYKWNFLLINDGSTDDTLSKMIMLHENDPEHWSYLDLSRNYGKELAMMAGFDYVEGDALIIMDADMQHPVSVIPEMLQWWEEGYDDVYAQRISSEESWFKRKTSHYYYKILQHFTHIPIQQDTGDFRLLDKSCVNALKKIREIERNTKGLYSWIGFRKKKITYHQLKRRFGTSRIDNRKLIDLAMNGLMAYSVFPLRLITIIGICLLFSSAIMGICLVYDDYFYSEKPDNIDIVIFVSLLLHSLHLLSLGIVGEYLARIYSEAKRRPCYLVRSFNGKKLR